MKKVCVATGSRAEYGLLKPLMNAILNHPDFTLQILVTGAHLSPDFGSTYQIIESDGFNIDAKVNMMLHSDTSVSIVQSMARGMSGFAEVLENFQPDVVLILGDRYEMLAFASAALLFKIPILHLHGGEISEGAYDDAIRHAISKMSHLHFVATEKYRNRLIQMGEQPQSVYNVGAIGLHYLQYETLLTKETLEKELGFEFQKYNYQITFHPETLAQKSSALQFGEVLRSIENQEDSFFIFTKSNADTDGRIINEMIDEFVQKNSHKAIAFYNLGNRKFLSVLKYCNAIMGNSSSGIIEAPALGIATINIGNRQLGREQASSVINVECSSEAIVEALEMVKSDEFIKSLKTINHPYESKDTVVEIMKLLERVDLKSLPNKKFYDLKF